MFDLFQKVLNPEKILDIQRLQYSEKILITDHVAAKKEQTVTEQISARGHFMSLFITGHYTTKSTLEAVDNGVNHLSGKLIDGSNQRPLFNNYIPFDILFSPGRVKILPLALDPVSRPLFYPHPFQYCFAVNGSIIFRVRNNSAFANIYAVCFYGIRFPFSVNAKRERIKHRNAS
jgi:hypothetical protein